VTQNGAPQSGVTVNWSTANGSLAPTSGPTGGDGIAASTWTLGPTAGAQTAQAAVVGATGSPVTFTATGTAGPPPPPPSTIAITVGNIFFQSNRNGTSNTAVDTVAVNGTATWTWVNTNATPHSVQSTGAPAFTSSALKTGNGQTYQFQFTQAGTYTYNCAEHGNAMTGRIVVR
jgi:copper binding plastocyanin/azurin family protein